MNMRWYSMPTFKKWIKDYLGLFIILKFISKQKKRLFVYGIIIPAIGLFFLNSLQIYLQSKEELRQIVTMNFSQSECNLRYACKMGYNFGCDFHPPLWDGDETEEQKAMRKNKEKMMLLMNKICIQKNLWR